MNFQNEKKQALEKIESNDRSRKGSIDRQIISLINIINSNKNFYTTSSCAGRIMLATQGKKKKDFRWLFVSHEIIEFAQIENILDDLPDKAVWFRMEPPIIHICAKTMESADKLLKIANDSGFRRSCLLSFKKRIILEIMFPQKLDAPISEGKELIVSEDYMRTLINFANDRLRESRRRLKNFERLMENYR